MRIAVNTRLILKNKLEGIGWFTYETMSRMAAQHPEHDFIFIFDRPVHPDFKFSENVKTVVAGPQTRHPILWYLWFEWVIPRVLKKHKADLFISPDAYASLRTKVPTITVIHDLNFVHHPEYLPKIVEKYYNYFVPKFIKHSVRIGTVSEYSKKDIIKAYNTDADKIDVYYNGSNNYYSPVSDEVKTETKSKFSREKDYFLFVGALNPRKNIPGLLKSYEKYREKAGRNNLLIVGSAMHKTEEIDACLKEMKYSEDVIFTGRLSVEDLSKVMSSAQALVMVSFFEGFGIPLVEAMYSEIPIICSNTTSLPEVVGEAALISDPNDYEAIANNMLRLETDEGLRLDLIEKGKIQREKFSWDMSAKRVWQSVEKVLDI